MRRTRAQLRMMSKPSRKAVAAAYAAQAPLDHVTKPLAKYKRAPIRDDAEVGEMGPPLPNKRD